MTPRAKQYPARCRGSAFILVIALLPTFSWLSLEALHRGNRQFVSGTAHAQLSHLRHTAHRAAAAAIHSARNGELAVGETHDSDGDTTVTRTVARLSPGKSATTITALTGFAVRVHAVSSFADTTWRMTFVWRDDASPQTGVWHLSKP